MADLLKLLSNEIVTALKAIEGGESIFTKMSKELGSDLINNKDHKYIDNTDGKYIDKASGQYIPLLKFNTANEQVIQLKQKVTDLETTHTAALKVVTDKLSTAETDFKAKLTVKSKTSALAKILEQNDKIGGSFLAPGLVSDLLLKDEEFMKTIEIGDDGKVLTTDKVIEAIKKHSQVSQLITKGKFHGTKTKQTNTNITSEEGIAIQALYDEAKKNGDRIGMLDAQTKLANLAPDED